jgi:hypothetical protein
MGRDAGSVHAADPGGQESATPSGASGARVASRRVTSLIWLASRRDLGWRRRRFVMAMGAITLVLALTLLLSGFRDGIDVETARTVRALGGDAFVVREGVAGPFTTVSQLGPRRG